MAFNLLRAPALFSPGFNDLTFSVQDTANVNQPNYKYIFKTYVNGVLVATNKLSPRPDGTCRFSPDGIIRDYLTGTFRTGAIAVTVPASNEELYYQCRISYEYEVGGVPTEFASGIANTTYYAWDCVAQWDDAKDLSAFVSSYAPASETVPHLNAIRVGTSLTDAVTLYDGEDVMLTSGFMASEAAAVDEFRCTAYCIDGSTKTYRRSLIPYSYHFLHYPAGNDGLSSMTWSSTIIPAGKSSSILTSEDLGYRLEWYFDNAPVLKPVWVRLLDPCKSKYTPAFLKYRSPRGGWWMVRVDFKRYEDVSSDKKTYERVMPYSYAYYAPFKVYGGESKSAFSMNTGWLTSQEAVDEVYECVTSPEAWLCVYGEDPRPVIVTGVDGSFEPYSQSGPVQFQIKATEAMYKNNNY